MLQLKAKGPDLWDSVIPEEARALSEDLAHVDELLSDERFLEPFVRRFDEKTGRRGLPVATYLRLMYLRRKHRLGYEALTVQVAASIPWRLFCGIGSKDRVPSPSTLAHLTKKYGEETLAELHGLVTEDLREWKINRRKSSGKVLRRRSIELHAESGGRLGRYASDALARLRSLGARIMALRPRRKSQMTLDLPS